MSATEYCPSCSEGILWKCTSCEKENDKSIHTHYEMSNELPNMVTSSVVGALACLATGLVVVV
jgi:hypothetical protein